MKILAIDTSTVVASVCIIEDEKILGEININYKQNHSTIIMPLIDELLAKLDLDIQDIDCFAVAKGPGSFTGLRIGVATIKAMAQASNNPIVAISTLEAMAYNIFDTSRYIVPIIDAKSERIFSGIYKFEEDKLEVVLEDSPLTILELIEYIESNDINPIFLGDGATVYKDLLSSKFSRECFAPSNLNIQKASSLASLAIDYFKAGKVISYRELEIEYLRKPQAQRELEERLNKK